LNQRLCDFLLYTLIAHSDKSAKAYRQKSIAVNASLWIIFFADNDVLFANQTLPIRLHSEQATSFSVGSPKDSMTKTI
jgi:hypothetical protein